MKSNLSPCSSSEGVAPQVAEPGHVQAVPAAAPAGTATARSGPPARNWHWGWWACSVSQFRELIPLKIKTYTLKVI